MQPQMPLYRKIARQIIAQVDAGLLKPCDKLPSTRQLMAEHDVSETVIRFAMVELKALGYVYGQPGRGVFVAERPQ